MPSMPMGAQSNATAADPAGGNGASWVDDGEKYALLALNMKFDDPLPLQEMTPHHWAFADEQFKLPAHWREWLGTVRTKEVEGSNLFLFSKMRSRAPEVIDDETNKLKHHAGLFYSGLLLASLAAPAHKPVMLAGYRKDGEIVVRTQDDYDPAIASIIRHYPPLTLAELQLAAEIASQIAAIEAEVSAGTSYWRFFRVLQLYLKTRTIIDNMERLHQYCRCIEGLIVPNAGYSGKKFKSRTELFIGTCSATWSTCTRTNTWRHLTAKRCSSW
jgi:hypothetical protein